MVFYLFNGIFILFCFVLFFVTFSICTLQVWKPQFLCNSSLIWSPYFNMTSHFYSHLPWISEWAAIRWQTAAGSFIVLTHWLSVSFPLCRERGIPCSSLEWVSHLIGPSTARHLLNSASTVWTTATSRRWVKRLYSSHWMRSELHTALSSQFLSLLLVQISVCGSWICYGPVIVLLICDLNCARASGARMLFARPWSFFLFLLITCLIMFVTKSFRAAALVYRSDIVSQATRLIILHNVWHIDVYSATNWQLI